MSMRSLCGVLGLALIGCGENSLGDIAGPGEARVGETVQITSEGTLRSSPDDVSWLSLLGYDDGGVLGSLTIIDVEVEGGTRAPELDEPATSYGEGTPVSNAVAIRHDKRAVSYRATAEVTCVAEGVVETAKRPNVLFGLEWDYRDGNSGGNLNREFGDFPFRCVP